MATIVDELATLMTQLPPRDQERVLSFALGLAHPSRQPAAFPHSPLPAGASPHALLRIHLDPEKGEAMAHALADCERIDLDE